MSPIKPVIFLFVISLGGIVYFFLHKTDDWQQAVLAFQTESAWCDRGELIEEIPKLLAREVEKNAKIYLKPKKHFGA
jgi:hypothetical protein